MIAALVLFGAGGDLAGRLVLPAVASLLTNGELAPGFRVVCAGEQDWSAAQFADHLRTRLTAQRVPDEKQDALLAVSDYRCADVTSRADVAAVLGRAGQTGPVAVYLALPTQLMPTAVENIGAHGLPVGSRIAVEKPFGHDADSAVALNAALAALPGVDTYRVDHFLAMTAVQGLPDARLPGTDRPVPWHGAAIERVEVLFDETLALEGRASFYDRAGALRDVMQNHVIQVLCTIVDHHHRAAALRAVRPLSPGDVAARTRRARYTAGRLADTDGADGRQVPDYAAEPGVDPARDTETFAEVELRLDSPRWQGTPFVLRAGKALERRRRGVLLHLRGEPGPPVWLDVDTEPLAEATAYRRVVADLLAGGSAFSVSGEEAALAWRVFDPVLAGWREGVVPMGSYPAGSSGP